MNELQRMKKAKGIVQLVILFALAVLILVAVVGALLWAASGFPLEVGAPLPLVGQGLAEPAGSGPAAPEPAAAEHGIAVTRADRVNRLPIVRVADEATCSCTCVVEPAIGGLKSAPNELEVERADEDDRPNKADRAE